MNLARLLEVDARASAQVRIAEQPGMIRSLAGFLAHSGDSWFWLIGLALLWTTREPFWQVRAWVLAVSILLTALVVMAIKFSVRRRRPEGAWGRIYRKSDPHSFPSGHAARALMLAVMTLGLGPLWLGVALFVWAPLVGLARVAMGVHYLSDIVVGMFLGAAMGLVLLQIFQRWIPGSVTSTCKSVTWKGP